MATRETDGPVKTDSGDAGSSGDALLLIWEQDRSRWAARVGAETVGTVTYQLAGGRYVLVSTYVADSHRHRGLASTLVAKALEDIRPTGRKITVVCPFVGDFINRHPGYADLIDRVHPGRGATGSDREPARAREAAPGTTAAAPAAPASAAAAGPGGGTAFDELNARIMVLGAISYRGPLTMAGVEGVFEEWAVEKWATISASTIEEQLRSLSADDLIRPSREGQGHEGTEYLCTDGGRTQLRLLLLELLNAEGFQPFNLVPLLHFVTALGVAELADGLRRRIIYIDEVLAHKASAIAHAPADGPDHASEGIRLDWHRFEADRAWSLEFIGRLYGAGA